MLKRKKQELPEVWQLLRIVSIQQINRFCIATNKHESSIPYLLTGVIHLPIFQGIDVKSEMKLGMKFAMFQF